ncbi:MAG: glutamate--tRNA ligase [Parcubacteria group bacterium]|nr:glutamate--tRNA ligase [Parcubacteria group bacterium]
MTVRVRFAPSPTGFLHIGGLRTALYNFLYAKRHGGKFILRIEDTDQTRVVPGGLQNILNTLQWAGLTWDEGPYIQSERFELYKKHAAHLVEKGSAYHCFCSSERLEEMRTQQMAAKQPPMYDGTCRELARDTREEMLQKGTAHVIRLKVPRDGETVIHDIIHGEVRFENKLIDDAVLIKSDGFPTYHLANVVDDHLMEITHVIRGDEWLPSTPKHVLLYAACGWHEPAFAHLPLLLNSDRSKLSKRTGDVAVEEYIAKGYLPEALINFVALLGWNPRADQEIYTVQELTDAFALERVNKAGAVVNFEKLRWLNSEYIRSIDLAALTELLVPWMKNAGLIEEVKPGQFVAPGLGEGVSLEYLRGVVSLARDRLALFGEIKELVEYFFVRAPAYDGSLLRWKKMTGDDVRARLTRTASLFTDLSEEEWTTEKLETAIKGAITAEKLGVGETLWPLRVALTGREASPGPFEVAAVLGRARTLERITQATEKIAKNL